METTNQKESTHPKETTYLNINEHDKAQLRKQFLAQRKAMSVDEVSSYSNSICTHILDMDLYNNAQTILAYMPIRNEVDTLPIIRQCLADGKDLYLPKVQGKDMNFYKVQTLDDLCTGVFGILEPVERNSLDKREGLMLVPGVAFSKDGFRIGYGGGYYDRYLEESHQFVTVGLCYESQLSEDISTEVFDKQLDFVITEKKWYGK